MSNPRGRQTDETIATERRVVDFIRRSYRCGNPVSIPQVTSELSVTGAVVRRSIERHGLRYMMADGRRQRESWLNEDQINDEIMRGPFTGPDGLPTYSDRLMLVINCVMGDDVKLSTKPELRERIIQAGIEIFDKRREEYRWSSDPRIVSLREQLGSVSDDE